MSDETTNDADAPDPELLGRAADGDRSALEELLRRIHPRVHRWAFARTGDRADADDLAQEALVRVVRGLPSFRGDARFGSWLYRIVANVHLDRERSARRRERKEEDGGMLHETAERAPDPADRLDRERLLARVRECFLGLTDRQREIFQLAELEGIPASEVAERLEIAPATVRVTLLRARRRVRERILQTDPELVEAFFS